MIAFVRGNVAELGPDEAVVEVGGIGMAVRCTPTTISHLRIGQQATVATSLVVREDSLTLYGFADADEREVFEILQTATGVGPRLALAVLAVHRPDPLRRAVADGNVSALVQVPGIGRKGAERMLIELKDRLGPPTGASAAAGAGTAGASTWQAQVHGALLGLGWSTREADDALSSVEPVAVGQQHPDVGVLLREALRTLNRSRA